MRPVSGPALTDGLPIAKVNKTGTLGATFAVPKVILKVGGASTARLAEAAFPDPPSFELTADVVLFSTPALPAETLATTEHEPFAAIVPPVKLMLAELAAAATFPAHEFVRPFGLPTRSPAGSASVNATPVSATLFGLVIVSVRLVLPFNGTLAAPNATAIEGGAGGSGGFDGVVPTGPDAAATTFKLALAAFPVPWSEPTALVVFVNAPVCVA